MATREIPAIEERSCDVCGDTTQQFGYMSTQRHKTVVDVNRIEFCYMGNSQGMHSRKYDLCDKCSDIITKFLSTPSKPFELGCEKCPESVTIAVPFGWAAKRLGLRDSNILDPFESTEVDRACEAALKPKQ